jgi:hypothetical protein
MRYWVYSLDEDTVKRYVKKWLENQAGVDHILKEQQLIPGGLATDFLTKNRGGKILHVVECKGSVDIGELAKGIGQSYQYDYQKQKNSLSKNAEAMFICPQDVEKELDLLRVPDGISVYLVSKSGTLYQRRRHPISKSAEMELQLPRTFYIRDVELNHLASIIKLIHEMGRKYPEGLPQEMILDAIGKEFPHIAAKGYNHLITLRSLGLVDEKNLLSPNGHEVHELVLTSKEAFLREMCDSFYPFIINVLNALVEIAQETGDPLSKINCSLQDIADRICRTWGTKVRFLYDPRTVGTTLRILKELGAIEESPGKIKLKKLVHSEFLPWGTRQTKLT